MVCYQCKHCKRHHQSNLQAFRCCQKVPKEEIKRRRKYWKGKTCQYCNLQVKEKSILQKTIIIILIIQLGSVVTFTSIYFIASYLSSPNMELIISETATEITLEKHINDFTTDNISIKLAELCNIGNNSRNSTFKKIKCVHDYYINFFEYKLTENGEKNPSELVETGGDCSDFSLAICSTLKILGIQCRVVADLFVDEKHNHAYAIIEVGNETCKIDQQFNNCNDKLKKIDYPFLDIKYKNIKQDYSVSFDKLEVVRKLCNCKTCFGCRSEFGIFRI